MYSDCLELHVVLTNKNADWDNFKPEWRPAQDVERYLLKDADNAVVMFNGKDSFVGEIRYTKPLYIIRNSSARDNWQYGFLPRNPNDEIPIEGNAATVIALSTGEYHIQASYPSS